MRTPVLAQQRNHRAQAALEGHCFFCGSMLSLSPVKKAIRMSSAPWPAARACGPARRGRRAARRGSAARPPSPPLAPCAPAAGRCAAHSHHAVYIDLTALSAPHARLAKLAPVRPMLRDSTGCGSNENHQYAALTLLASCMPMHVRMSGAIQIRLPAKRLSWHPGSWQYVLGCGWRAPGW